VPVGVRRGSKSPGLTHIISRLRKIVDDVFHEILAVRAVFIEPQGFGSVKVPPQLSADEAEP